MVHSVVVRVLDWCALGLSCGVALVSVALALYVVPWTQVARQQAFTREFNFLWITRCCLQLLAALYSLSLNLRLQLLWSYDSLMINPHGFQTDAMCRVYIGLTFGLLEPAFLLLVLFSCNNILKMPTSHEEYQGAEDMLSPPPETPPRTNPNLRILVWTVALTVPMCALQVFAALFSKILTNLPYHEALLRRFFSASMPAIAEQCPSGVRHPNCVTCVFPEFSTLISAGLGLVYMLVLWHILGKVAKTAMNRTVAMRIRLLQMCITVFFCASVAVRGITVLFDPYSLGFQGSRMAHVVCVCMLVLSVAAILVFKPVYDNRVAYNRIDLLMKANSNQPTELMPLVHFKHDGGDSESECGLGRLSHTSQ